MISQNSQDSCLEAASWKTPAAESVGAVGGDEWMAWGHGAASRALELEGLERLAGLVMMPRQGVGSELSGPRGEGGCVGVCLWTQLWLWGQLHVEHQPFQCWLSVEPQQVWEWGARNRGCRLGAASFPAPWLCRRI